LRGPNHYQTLLDAQREALEAREAIPANQPDHAAAVPEPEYLTAIEKLDAERAIKQAEVDERYLAGKINGHEARYEMLGWEMEPLEKQRGQEEHVVRSEPAEIQQRSHAETERANAEHQLTDGKEMTDAQQAKFDRLLENIHRETENELTRQPDDTLTRSGREP
jgi:hypothetical protein